MRQVLMYPGEDGYWVVEVPSLPGCVHPDWCDARPISPVSGLIPASQARPVRSRHHGTSWMR
ncbi:MAG: type II toxin-antitoxin system HicB family antitoxin [Promethearchaeota archaeon]